MPLAVKAAAIGKKQAWCGAWQFPNAQHWCEMQPNVYTLLLQPEWQLWSWFHSLLILAVTRVCRHCMHHKVALGNHHTLHHKASR